MQDSESVSDHFGILHIIGLSNGKEKFLLYKVVLNFRFYHDFKQPSGGVLINMKQIYRRTPVSKGDFNKLTKQLY